MTDTGIPLRIRKIGHVGLYCRDLAKMVDFYTRVLGFKVSDVNEKGMTFLRFGSDHHSFVLAQMSPDEVKKGAGATLLQQIAMEVASLDALKRIRKTLLDQGVNVRGKIKHEGPGNDYTFDFDDPAGRKRRPVVDTRNSSSAASFTGTNAAEPYSASRNGSRKV